VLFVVRLISFFLLFYFAWYLLTPVYNHILAPPASLVLKISEMTGIHLTNSLEPKGDHIFVHHAASEKNPNFTVRVWARVVHFDLVLLSALIWAVPNIDRKKRIRIFLCGLLILFPLHLLKILIFVKHEYSLHVRVGGVYNWSTSGRIVYRYLADFILLVANQVLPILIWSLLYAKYWWRKDPTVYRG
jgi:hypothetical protein